MDVSIHNWLKDVQLVHLHSTKRIEFIDCHLEGSPSHIMLMATTLQIEKSGKATIVEAGAGCLANQAWTKPAFRGICSLLMACIACDSPDNANGRNSDQETSLIGRSIYGVQYAKSKCKVQSGLNGWTYAGIPSSKISMQVCYQRL